MPEPDLFPDRLDRTLRELADASARLVRSVDGMPDAAWDGPSLLPGWTRAHVVAHLALNGEALAAVLDGVARDEPVPQYTSTADRDAAIEQLAAEGVATLRERLLGSTTLFADAAAAVPADRWQGTFERTPGAAPRRLTAIPGARLREVEVHHVDLGLGATRADWPQSFCVHLVGAMLRAWPADRPLRLHAVDLDRTWETDPSASTTVRGTAADLGWWLTGRGTGEGLTTDDGSELPRIEGL